LKKQLSFLQNAFSSVIRQSIYASTLLKDDTQNGIAKLFLIAIVI